MILAIIYTVIIFIGIAVLYIGIPSIIKIILRHNFLNKIQKSGYIYLTFDDGPNPDSTPEILSLLKNYGIKATFFITGENLEKYPELIYEIIKFGHVIGNHGYRHLHAWKINPIKSLFNFYKFDEALKKIKLLPDTIKFYRPPYGKLNIFSLFYILLNKLKIIYWDIDPRDFENPLPQSIAEYIVKKIQQGNKIILLHDGRSNTNNTDSKVTVNTLRLILATIDSKKFSSFNR